MGAIRLVPKKPGGRSARQIQKCNQALLKGYEREGAMSNSRMREGPFRPDMRRGAMGCFEGVSGPSIALKDNLPYIGSNARRR
jgi:hypothetical protein